MSVRRTPEGIEVPPPSPNDVLYEKGDGFARVTLNRPVVLNAIDWSLRRWLMAALARADAADDVKAVVLTGAGRAFCAGGDLQSTPPDDDEPIASAVDIAMKIWTMPKPVIAAVRGHAVGQGCELAGICDLTIASDDAKFGEIQIRHGFGPPLLIAPFLLGLKQAKELLLLGDMVDAAEAQRLGLVNRVVPAEHVLEAAEAVARKLAALSERAVRTNKALVNRVYELAGFRTALDYASDPLITALRSAEGTDRNDPHLATLQRQGWEAFKRSRDALYRGEQQPGERVEG